MPRKKKPAAVPARSKTPAREVASKLAGGQMTPAEREQEEALRLKLWNYRVNEGMSWPDIGRKMGMASEQIAAHRPYIEESVRQDVELSRATIREAQIKDLLDSLGECRKMLRDPRLAPYLRLQAMDRQAKLWDRLAKAEGTDRHRDKLEVSGPAGANGQVDYLARATIIDAYRARKRIQEADARVLPPPSPKAITDGTGS